MSRFDSLVDRLLVYEGGYVLHNVKGDRGGQTYGGISRRHHPLWPGWSATDEERPELVRSFYLHHFWLPNRLDDVEDDEKAYQIFSYCVHAGPKRGVKTAQAVVGVAQDGDIGPITLGAINASGAEFVPLYSLRRIAHYNKLARKDKSQRKFLVGWVGRALMEAGVPE